MRFLMVGWDSQVRTLAHIAEQSVSFGNEVCLVVDKDSALYVPALIGFNPNLVLMSVPKDKIEERILPIMTQVKTKNIPYVFYAHSLQVLDYVSRSDAYEYCKAIFIPNGIIRIRAESSNGIAIIQVNHATEVAIRLKYLA